MLATAYSVVTEHAEATRVFRQVLDVACLLVFG